MPGASWSVLRSELGSVASVVAVLTELRWWAANASTGVSGRAGCLRSGVGGDGGVQPVAVQLGGGSVPGVGAVDGVYEELRRRSSLAQAELLGVQRVRRLQLSVGVGVLQHGRVSE